MSGESQEELKERLSSMQYRVTQEAATEPPGTGEFTDHYENGNYNCVICHKLLFLSEHKYKWGCGWPGFFDKDRDIKEISDSSLGMTRVEVRCGNCDSHLGHVFNDGPEPTGVRYCINSASLEFDPK